MDDNARRTDATIAEYCVKGYTQTREAASLCRALIAVMILLVVILTVVAVILVASLTQYMIGSVKYIIIGATAVYVGGVPLLIFAFLRPIFFYIETKSTEAMLRCEYAIQRQQGETDEDNQP